MSTSWVQVQGSTLRRPAGTARIDENDPDQLTVTVTVRGRDLEGLDATDRALDLTREELAQRHGADSNDPERVASLYPDQGLQIDEQSVPRRCVVVRDTARAIANAFQAGFGSYRHPGGTYRGLDGPYSVPTDLADLITAVLGLEDRPQAETRQLWQGETSVGPRSARIAKDETT